MNTCSWCDNQAVASKRATGRRVFACVAHLYKIKKGHN